MTEPTKLMSIGQFSALTRLSVRMLRHYDAQEVLVPADIDRWTGYRRYAPHQLAVAADIRNLRDVGFGVSAIGILLASRSTPAWATALQVQRDILAEEVRAAQARLNLVSHMLNKGETTMTIEVTRTTVPAMTVATLRGIVPTYSDEGQLWEVMDPELRKQQIHPVGPAGVIEHNDEYTEHDVDLSIFVPVAPGTTVAAPLEIVTLPERDCLVAHVLGSYSQITEAHDLIGSRIAQDGLSPRADGTLASKVFNLWVKSPQTASEEDLVSEIYQPLA